MYTSINFKTKKELKEYIKAGKRVSVWDPSPFNNNVDNGTVYLEGPHYPMPHKWYAKATVLNGAIIKIS